MAKRITLELSDARFDKLSALVRVSYPNACILWIDQVENATLEGDFENRKKELDASGEKYTKMQLFHGTNSALIDTICYTGFDPSKNVRSAYGYGTYFAKHASYSRSYTNSDGDAISYMFIADVLIGNMYHESVPSKTSGPFRTRVDNVSNPSIFVVPYHDATYPRFVLAFHKNAS